LSWAKGLRVGPGTRASARVLSVKRPEIAVQIANVDRPDIHILEGIAEVEANPFQTMGPPIFVLGSVKTATGFSHSQMMS